MIETLALAAALRGQLEREAQAAFPRECCGLIEGMIGLSKGDAAALHPTPNIASEPDRFEIDPAAHIALLRRLRGTGRAIIGCYHSHPNGRPEPSWCDADSAGETGFLWLIAAIENNLAAPHLACFNWTGSVFKPVQLTFPLPHACGGEG
jgi:proteasome lid subunit RPN8/RPN11